MRTLLRRLVSRAERCAPGSAPARPPAHSNVWGALPAAAAAALVLAGAACSTDPAGNYLGGFGDPVRGAALYAPQNFGDTARWAGDPAGAAMAAQQIEFLADQLRTNPIYAPQVNPAVTTSMDAARAEMRGYLGITPDAPPALVIAALRRAADALRAGSRAGAEAALSSPVFTAGPAGTLARLSSMPRLPQAAAAADIAATNFQNMGGRRF